eukprot:TRINITY_DN8381_c0_g1_i4.p1 TRINITY_DN8381_c0_g1~~TRINITY_DN8381_c0_g1_i4.p1  ORF type:complete len:754 (+),score=348.93 TRINITY_DN8381_c0_g1_i4:90-2264(+)
MSARSCAGLSEGCPHQSGGDGEPIEVHEEECIYARYQKMNKTFRDKQDLLSRRIKEKETLLEPLKAELAQTQAALSAKDNELAQFRQMADQVNPYVASLQSQIAERDAKLQEVAQLIHQADQARTQYSALEASFLELRKTSSTREASLVQDLSLAQQTVLQHQQIVRQHEQAILSLQQIVRQHEQTISQLRLSLSDPNAIPSLISAPSSSPSPSPSGDSVQLLTENAQLKAENAQLKEEQARLRKKMTKLEKENTALHDKCDTLEQAVSSPPPPSSSSSSDKKDQKDQPGFFQRFLGFGSTPSPSTNQSSGSPPSGSPPGSSASYYPANPRSSTSGQLSNSGSYSSSSPSTPSLPTSSSSAAYSSYSSYASAVGSGSAMDDDDDSNDQSGGSTTVMHTIQSLVGIKVEEVVDRMWVKRGFPSGSPAVFQAPDFSTLCFLVFTFPLSEAKLAPYNVQNVELKVSDLTITFFGPKSDKKKLLDDLKAFVSSLSGSAVSLTLRTKSPLPTPTGYAKHYCMTLSPNSALFKRKFGGKKQLQLVVGDICAERSDAIVNPIGEDLNMSGGLSAIIIGKAGLSVRNECANYARKNYKLPVGECFSTGAGDMAMKFLIHASGPRNKDPTDLAKTVKSVVEKAESLGCRSLTLPLISTGVFGFPVPDCARITIDVVSAFLSASSSLEDVRVICRDQATLDSISHIMSKQKAIEARFASAPDMHRFISDHPDTP